MSKAFIKTADNMSEATFHILCEGLKKKFGDDTVFKREIDNSIIGGFVLYLNGTVYDASLSTQLDRLKKHISQ